MQEFASNLRYLRKQKNLSQEDIAKIVNKDRSLISQWEADTKTATVEDIIKLSNYFNIPMDKLVDSNLSKEETKELDELDVLFSKHKDTLSESDINIIKAIILERKKQIDKELDGE